jgi:hypothetical protein
MSRVFMGVPDIIGKKSFQAPLVDWNNVIEQVVAATLKPVLRDSVLPKILKRGLDGINLHDRTASGISRPYFDVMVKDEESGS